RLMRYDLISPKTLHHYSLDNFEAEGRLLGRAHNFHFKNKSVTIALPSNSDIDRAALDYRDEIGTLSSHRQGPKGSIIDPVYSLYRLTVSG
ncbi:hypothetical protein L9G16_20680, partial [Shewanella sp. A25]|nr:hypothetical protein [Shewanella shenzhenensis]